MSVKTIQRVDSGCPATGLTHFRCESEAKSAPRTRRRMGRHARVADSVLVSGITREIRVKIATEHDELEDAFRLLATNYRACGYEPESPGIYRFTPFHVLPGTVTLVAKHREQVVATLSVVPDTKLCGLPLEPVYTEEINGLRDQGRNLAEAMSLADRDLGVREFVRVFKTLIMVGIQYHVRRGGDSWVIAVHPKHRGFYEKVLGFVPLGPRRAYPSVQNYPAEAFVSGVDLLRKHAPGMYDEVFGESLPDSVLRGPRWSPSRVQYFGRQSTQADGRKFQDLLARVERFGGSSRWDEIVD